MEIKNRRLLIIGLIIALLATGVAYAAWTQALTITTNASTGTFDVAITNYQETGTTSTGVTISNTTTIPASGVDEIVVDIDNLYPGASVEFDVTVTNFGTIPVDLVGVDYTADSGSGLDTMTSDLVVEYTINGGSDLTGNQDYSVTSPVSDLAQNGTTTFKVKVSLDANAAQSLEGDNYQFKIAPTYEQAN